MSVDDKEIQISRYSVGPDHMFNKTGTTFLFSICRQLTKKQCNKYTFISGSKNISFRDITVPGKTCNAEREGTRSC